MGQPPQISISVAIMSHPRRRRFVGQLRSKLDRPATAVWDRYNDRWDTGRRSLLAYDPQATHHCVIQDDAVIPHDLIGGVEMALQQVPARPGDPAPLCLYAGKTKPYKTQMDRRARRPGVSWLRMPSLYWGVGIVLPTEIIEPMTSWCDRQTHIRNYDLRIGAWLTHKRIPVWYPYPSLVDHRNSASLVAERTARNSRRAHQFIGADVSALDYDWKGKYVDIVPTPTHMNVAAQRAYRHRR